MATVTLDAIGPIAPPQGAEKEYRESIFRIVRGGDPPRNFDDIKYRANRRHKHVRIDLATGRKRLPALEVVLTPPGQLPEEIEAARLEAELAKPAANCPVGELHRAIHEIDRPDTPVYASERKMQAHRARTAARSERIVASQTVGMTTDQRVLDRIHELLGESQSLRNRREDRERVDALRAEQRCKELYGLLEQLDNEPDTERPIGDAGLQSSHGEPLMHGRAERIRRLEKQLEYFRSLIPQREQVLATNAREEEQAQKLDDERSRLQKCSWTLEAMRFAPTGVRVSHG